MAYTAEDIIAILDDDTEIIINGETMTKGEYASMRGVCRLYAAQLSSEKESKGTHAENGVGFNHAHGLIGALLGEWLDGGKRDGVMRRTTRGAVNKFVFHGYGLDGKKQWDRINSSFVGRDRREVCRYLAGFYAQQLADYANGDKRGADQIVR